MHNSWVRMVGVFEIVGAVLMLAFGLQPQFCSTELHARIPLVTWATASFTFLAGILLVGGHHSGVLMSLCVQCAQGISFNAGWRYVLLAGPKLTWVISSVGTGFYAGAGGLFIMTDAPPDGTLNASGLGADVNLTFVGKPLAEASWALGLNLVALYFAWKLWSLRKEHASERVGPTA